MEFLEIAQTVTVVALVMWALTLIIIFGLIKIFKNK